VLAIIYAIEMAVLGLIYRFLSEVPYRIIAPPVVVVIVLMAWTTAYLDMKKRGER
jgi:cell division protein FtsW (lipid II flippase)